MLVKNALSFPAVGETKLKGYGGDIIDFIISEQLMDEETWKIFVNQFRTREDSTNDGWRGEYWGKMMRGASLTYRATKNEKLYTVLVRSVCDMLTTQDDLGRFSAYSTETEFRAWDVWARKYVMLGFIYFLDICKSRALEKKIIRALCKHADYIVSKIGDSKGKKSIFETSHVIGALNSCSILEPFVKLYTLTGKKSYLDFATYIVSTGFCQSTNLIEAALTKSLYPYQFPVTKAYELTSCFEGLLEYYKVTGDPDHLKAVESFVDMIVKTDYTIVGGSGCRHEFLDNSTLMQTEPPKEEVMQETCVTVTFMKMCAKLLSLTGKAKYAEYIEKSGLNALYGAVNNERQSMSRTLMRTWIQGGKMVLIEDHPSFPFDSYSPLLNDRRGLRAGGMQFIDGGKSYGCCVCIGSAGVAIMSLFALMKNEHGIYVNLYNDARFVTDSFGSKVKLTLRADPYSSHGAKISIDADGSEFDLALRVPEWAEDFSVLVNGEAASGQMTDGYLVIRKAWGKDRVQISFKAPVRMRVLNGKIAFTKGPIALSRDARFGDVTTSVGIAAKDGKSVRARRIKSPTFNCNTAYEITTSDGAVALCDYAQAGKDFDTESSRLSVWQNVK